jgi:hypothetical protein
VGSQLGLVAYHGGLVWFVDCKAEIRIVMNSINQLLNPFRQRYQAGLLLRVICDLTAGIFLAGSVCLCLDAVFAFHPLGRVLLIGVSGVALLLLLAVRGYGMWSLSSAWLARYLDRASNDRRRSILNAWQLEIADNKEGVNNAFVASARRDAIEYISRLSLWVAFPKLHVWYAGRRLLIALCIFVLLAIVKPVLISTVLPRFVDPWADNPPFSDLHFELADSEVRIPYGQDVELKTKIMGSVSREVNLIIRSAGAEKRALCFAGDKGERTARVKHVVEPLVCWFETGGRWGIGRARSRRVTVSPILTPKVLHLTAAIVPPAYTLREPETFTVTKQKLNVPWGGNLELSVVSNRPLKCIRVAFAKTGNRQVVKPIEVKCGGAMSGRVCLRIKTSNEVLLELEDIEGNRSLQNRRLKVRCLADKLPQVAISEPGLMTMATPDAVIRIMGDAGDDYGLTSLRLVRTLSGFRDRAGVLALDGDVPRQQEFTKNFNFGRLGLEPGDNLEFFVEASDNNPRGAGYASSAIHQVKIISSEEYMRLIQQKTSIEDFTAYMADVHEQLQELAEAAAKAEKKLLARDATDELEIAAALAEVRSKHESLERLAKKRARGPFVFDFEKDAAGMFAAIAKRLQELKPGKSKQEQLAYLQDLQTFNAAQKKERQELAKAVALTAAAARLMRNANKYVRLVMEQQELSRKLNSLRDRAKREDVAKALAYHGVQQREIAESLAKLIVEMNGDLKKLDAEKFVKLYSSSKNFLERFTRLQVEPDFTAVQTACKEKAVTSAAQAAGRAARKLAQLISDCNGINNDGKQCVVFNPRWPSMSETIQQLASGFSYGGNGDGYSMGSNNARNMAVYGPEGLASGLRGGRKKRGRFGGKHHSPTVMTAKIKTQARQAGARRQLETELFPQQYREELGAYFDDRLAIEKTGAIDKQGGK